ncbi:MAG: exodeoxyribonuclease VII small subunit [Gammaproteobacteria bacterium]
MSSNKSPKNFEDALRELEQMTVTLEGGEVPLDDIVSSCERGAELIKYCRDKLDAARGKIQKLEEQTLIGMGDVDD